MGLVSNGFASKENDEAGCTQTLPRAPAIRSDLNYQPGIIIERVARQAFQLRADQSCHGAQHLWLFSYLR